MLADATLVRRDWDAVKESMVPLCLNSLYPSSRFKLEIPSPNELTYIAYSGWQRLERQYAVVSNWTASNFLDELLSVYAATQLVAILLRSALDAASLPTVSNSEEMQVDGYDTTPRRFSEDMVSVFLAPALAELAQPLDESLRRYAMQNLLPPLLKVAAKFGWLDDVSPEKRTVEARYSPVVDTRFDSYFDFCLSTYYQHVPELLVGVVRMSIKSNMARRRTQQRGVTMGFCL